MIGGVIIGALVALPIGYAVERLIHLGDATAPLPQPPAADAPRPES